MINVLDIYVPINTLLKNTFGIAVKISTLTKILAVRL